jgi:hypothetical protein
MNYINKIKFNNQISRFIGNDSKIKLSVNKKQLENKNYKKHINYYNKIIVRSYSSNSGSDPDDDPWKTLCFVGILGLYNHYLNTKDKKRD